MLLNDGIDASFGGGMIEVGVVVGTGAVSATDETDVEPTGVAAGAAVSIEFDEVSAI